MEKDDRAAEVEDALDTTDQLHNDIARLKRIGILAPEESQDAHEQVKHVEETLSEKLPED